MKCYSCSDTKCDFFVIGCAQQQTLGMNVCKSAMTKNPISNVYLYLIICTLKIMPPFLQHQNITLHLEAFSIYRVLHRIRRSCPTKDSLSATLPPISRCVNRKQGLTANNEPSSSSSQCLAVHAHPYRADRRPLRRFVAPTRRQVVLHPLPQRRSELPSEPRQRKSGQRTSSPEKNARRKQSEREMSRR